ncbi:pitrilysin family protein [uncultured Tessaracoccus sp.]|uniref:M16 family metallopeptidase n=1 Tax=uncultured Tessaracoccus sp. TaxID=905023 RepID=UPI00260BC402|nr:pitrilysin family protein [uncultured Tessaracoccus sp.]
MQRPEVRLTDAPWQFPMPHIQTLGNGLTVWHFPMPGQNVAAFELVQPIRLADEPLALEGVATIALHALDEATRSHPDIQELIDAQGAAFHASASHHSTRLGGLVPARRFTEFLPLFVEILSEPAYLDDDVALHIEAQTAAYHTRLSSPTAAASAAMRAGLYGQDQRRGRPAAGTPSTLANITRDDVAAWHAAQFAPEQATLIVVGELPSLETSVLEAWTATAQRSPLVEPATRSRRILVVDFPDAVQATIQVAQRSISRTHPQWAAVRLAGHVIAGGFASRLNLELRERLGYTYGIGGGFAPDPTGSLFQVTTNTRTDVAGDALRRILDACRLDEPIQPDEIEDAKAFRIGIAPLANETSADIATQAAALAEADLHTDFINRHTDALSAVTTGDASQAWRALISPDEVTVVIAGDARTLIPQLDEHSPEVVEPGT